MFKPGDKVVCINTQNWSTSGGGFIKTRNKKLRLNRVYTIKEFNPRTKMKEVFLEEVARNSFKLQRFISLEEFNFNKKLNNLIEEKESMSMSTATRIRYKQISEHVYEATQAFSHSTNGANYKVRLNTLENQVYILDAQSELPAKTVFATDLKALKHAAKNALKELGVQFGSESRVRSNVSNVQT